VFDAILLIFAQVRKCHEFIDLLAIQISHKLRHFLSSFAGNSYTEEWHNILFPNKDHFRNLNIFVEFIDTVSNFVSTVNHGHVTVCSDTL